ncbi:hypothetical protein [Nocardia brevicatena]|uniref:hypothetical protein n=1 Tax=Nocardia brevicatena TaxID=37327 RepID=UPI0012FAB92D|nr:hypothetical protein [Nocardia brevicatena]
MLHPFRRTAVLPALSAALLALSAVLAGCGVPDRPEPVVSASVTGAPSPTESPQQRDRRIRDELVELGCDTNSCIQTYFACRDGYLSGEMCDFYRKHPLE